MFEEDKSNTEIEESKPPQYPVLPSLSSKQQVRHAPLKEYCMLQKNSKRFDIKEKVKQKNKIKGNGFRKSPLYGHPY